MISAPEPYTSEHQTNTFNCGNETLNEWLLKRTLKNQKSGSSRSPKPIPVIVLGRLAVDLHFQKQRLGSSLLKNALLRTLTVSKNIGVQAVLVHAISEDARKFYQKYGFKQSPINSMTMMLSVQSIKAHF